MCGLAGFTVNRPTTRCDVDRTLTAMLESIAHRGPDQRGIKVFEHVALGHNRLTVIEPQGGRQPRVDAKSGSALIYNGEIYNHRSFDREIAAAGGQIRDHCDTETLFWLIAIHGIDKAVRLVNGMFAFAYYQPGNETLYLARDEFGQKPIFYAEVGGELVFASEICALRRHPLLKRVTPDEIALSVYLMMEYVPGSATGIAEIRELPAGHVLRYRHGRAELTKYHHMPRTVPRPEIDETRAIPKLDRRLHQAVEQQLVADVPVGIFLSGGLDSSLIAAMARRNHSDISTFTIRFPQASFDESSHAEEVAHVIGTRHETIELSGQNCADAFNELIEKVDQPFADSSLLPTYLLCKATRRHVTVALGGDGADELFLGYPNFKLARLAPYIARLPMSAGSAVRGLTKLFPGSHSYMNWRFLFRQLSNGFGIPASMQSIFWMSALPPVEQQELWINHHDCQTSILEQLTTQLEPSAQGPLALQYQRHFLNYYLACDILVKTDRASMYNSLEVRSPFLSTRVASCALTLPHALLLKGLNSKYILKRVADAYLPSHTIARRKHGFAMPVSNLIREDLRDSVEAVLLDTSNCMYQYLNSDVVASLWKDHVSKRQDRGKAVWALFMLANFFRKHF